MRVLAFFSVVLAVATSYPVVKTWFFNELTDTIDSREFEKVDSDLKPYIENAFNTMMLGMVSEEAEKFVQAAVPSPSGGATWTIAELTNALADPQIKPKTIYRDALEQAYDFVQHKKQTGTMEDSVQVLTMALDVSTWTQSDLTEALKSPSTKADLIPYLEKARAELQKALDNGETRTTVHMVTPVGLIPHKVDFGYITKPSKHTEVEKGYSWY